MNLLAQIDITSPKTMGVAILGLICTLSTMILGRIIQSFRGGASLKDAVMGVLCGTNGPKPPKPPVALIIGAILLSLTAGAQAQGSFTNSFIQAWSGWQYKGQSSESTAILGASVDIGSFNAGQLGRLDYGIGTEITLGNASQACEGMSIRAELLKPINDFQILAFVGAGRAFNDAKFTGSFGVGLNYNLVKSAYIGTGVQFQFENGRQLDYMPVAKTGWTF